MDDYLAERYGRTKVRAAQDRRRWIIVAALLVLAFLLWSIYTNFFMPRPPVFATTGFVIESPQRATVTFEVTPGSGDGVCAVQVLSQSYAVVGYREVAVDSEPAGKKQTRTVAINTTELGVSGLVDKCWLK